MFTHCRLGRSSSEQTDQDAPERRLARYSQIACKSVASAVEKRGKDGESVCVCTHVCVHVQRHVYMYECECAMHMTVYVCIHVYTCVHMCTHVCLTYVYAFMHTCVIRDTLTENKAGETLEE